MCYIHLLHVDYYMLIKIINEVRYANILIEQKPRDVNGDWKPGLLGYFIIITLWGGKSLFTCHNFNSFQVICSFSLLLKHMHSSILRRRGPSQNLQSGKGWIWAYFPFEYLKMFPSKFPLSKCVTVVNEEGNWLWQSLKFSLGIWTPPLLALPFSLALINNSFLIMDRLPLLPCKSSAIEYGSVMQFSSGT